MFNDYFNNWRMLGVFLTTLELESFFKFQEFSSAVDFFEYFDLIDVIVPLKILLRAPLFFF